MTVVSGVVALVGAVSGVAASLEDSGLDTLDPGGVGTVQAESTDSGAAATSSGTGRAASLAAAA